MPIRMRQSSWEFPLINGQVHGRRRSKTDFKDPRRVRPASVLVKCRRWLLSISKDTQQLPPLPSQTATDNFRPRGRGAGRCALERQSTCFYQLRLATVRAQHRRHHAWKGITRQPCPALIRAEFYPRARGRYPVKPRQSKRVIGMVDLAGDGGHQCTLSVSPSVQSL